MSAAAPMFALVDGNNFYVSCEIQFRPSLRGLPVCVLSSNDGCAVARSQEAKALGVKMGQPWFEFSHLEESHGLVALSANFSLYGDMSDRMMSIAAGLGPAQEIYSIDESFVSLAGVPGDLSKRAWIIRERIRRWVGIPCCVGIGPTKTLAKFANHVGKEAERKPGSYPSELAVVCDLSKMPRSGVDELLAATEVGDVWGVGRKLGAQLREAGATTALDLARMDPATVRAKWSITLARVARELAGESCMALEDEPPAKKQIAVTRSFGRPADSLEELCEAVSEFAASAARKLRKQGGTAGQVMVFCRTSPFRKGPQFSRSTVVPLRRPSADDSALASAAIAGLRRIYEPGFAIAKAGVMLLDLQSGSIDQGELDFGEPEPGRDKGALMGALDAINTRWGKGSVKIGSGQVGAKPRQWTMKQERRTPAYTTEWDDIPTAKA